jgi:hypothetical protein
MAMVKGLCSATAGFLAAAAVAALGLSASMVFGGGWFDLEAALMVPVVFFPFVLVAVVVLGVPTFLLMRPLAPGKWWMAVAAGLVLGFLLRCILSVMLGTSLDLAIVPLTALSALVFWRVWRWVEERQSACCAC